MKKVYYEMLNRAYEQYESVLAIPNRSLDAYEEARAELNEYIGALKYVRASEFMKDLNENYEWFQAHKELQSFLYNYFKYRNLSNMSL